MSSRQRRAASGQAPSEASPSPSIDAMRRLANFAFERNDEELLGCVWDATREAARALAHFNPGDPRLPEWQTLALAFETALEDIDTEGSKEARLLAAELRSTMSMVDRNPADELVGRPTARRVLAALLALGGQDCPMVLLQKESKLGTTHLSNILAPLVAHGLTTVAPDPNDGRRRRVSLTPAGTAAMDAEGYADGQEHTRSDHTFRRTYTHVAVQPRHSEDFRSKIVSRSGLAAA